MFTCQCFLFHYRAYLLQNNWEHIAVSNCTGTFGISYRLCKVWLCILITSHGGMLSSSRWETLLWFPNPTLPFSPCVSCSHSKFHHIPACIPQSLPCKPRLSASFITVLPSTTSPGYHDHFSQIVHVIKWKQQTWKLRGNKNSVCT